MSFATKQFYIYRYFYFATLFLNLTQEILKCEMIYFKKYIGPTKIFVLSTRTSLY